MPHHKSNFKRMRQSEKQRDRNRAWRSHLRGAIRDLRATEPGAPDLAGKYRTVVSMIDRAASRRLLHRRTADRYKSRLARHAASKPA
ncbi:MAG TPA: 30S ribosomal protein S20 [candidate division Zixibacteria bacterium]|nr:30S ribosomal protein S20 [candidate division Zixibacteria bacterium]MDD4917086.1 30S ribosomal protein S20 [candidate division Zixibacteria bacterium]MDM7972932.1 30S ribosomal protein S20 [candidate division Zixibacteria bacterium]HOD65312.1 30S ribosomal protein S20 [candidate division Zixibacteria bacterium]HOZ07123.1 30S ribosomal protein S20 [candidate division Zixibacteria bacterium]